MLIPNLEKRYKVKAAPKYCENLVSKLEEVTGKKVKECATPIVPNFLGEDETEQLSDEMCGHFWIGVVHQP